MWVDDRGAAVQVTSLLSKVVAQFKLQEALTVTHTRESDRTPCPGVRLHVFLRFFLSGTCLVSRAAPDIQPQSKDGVN